MDQTNQEKLYLMAKSCLGTDASPNDVAPDEYGCMETVDDIVFKTFGTYINGTVDKVTVSTARGYAILKDSPDFEEVTEPEPGDIIISPTGYGTNPHMPNGHIGIMGKFGILSNNSFTGKFEENFTLFSWKQRYGLVGGYPIHFFRRK